MKNTASRHPWQNTAKATSCLLAPVLWTVVGATALITTLGVAVGIDPIETATGFCPKAIAAVWPLAKILIVLWAIVAVSDFVKQIDLREAIRYAGWKHDRISIPCTVPAYPLPTPPTTVASEVRLQSSTYTPNLRWRHGHHPPMVYEGDVPTNNVANHRAKGGTLCSTSHGSVSCR